MGLERGVKPVLGTGSERYASDSGTSCHLPASVPVWQPAATMITSEYEVFLPPAASGKGRCFKSNRLSDCQGREFDECPCFWGRFRSGEISPCHRVFLLVGFVATYALLAPSPKPATAPPTEFSAVRALEHSKVIARVPHPMGTAADDNVRAYIIRKLAEMGVEAQEQPSRKVRRGTIEVSTNVIGRIPGTANSKAFTLMAHYDSVAYGPGAADDGSGVITLLETARALKAGPPLKNDVLLVFTDGEEAGEVGAEAFMRTPMADQVGVLVNFETRGTSGPSLMFETSPGNGWLIAEAAKAGVDLRACSLMYSVFKAMPFNTDFNEAKRRGLKGFNVAFIDDFCWYHTKNDTPEHLSLASVQNQRLLCPGSGAAFWQPAA